MKLTKATLLIFAVASLRGSEWDLLHSERVLLDKVLSATTPGNDRSGVGLAILERIAIGQASSIGTGWETAVGIPEGTFKGREFTDPGIRSYAFEEIGKCELPEALTFLSTLKEADLQADYSGQLWPASQIGLTIAHLTRTTDPAQKVEILKGALKTVASAWAEEELCDMGALSALSEVQQAMRRGWSGKRGEDFAAFCGARMQIIARDADRVRALSSLFSSFVALSGNYDGQRLLGWAISQLEIMGTPDAAAALDRFQAEVERILKGDPNAPYLDELRGRIVSSRKRMRSK